MIKVALNEEMTLFSALHQYIMYLLAVRKRAIICVSVGSRLVFSGVMQNVVNTSHDMQWFYIIMACINSHGFKI